MILGEAQQTKHEGELPSSTPHDQFKLALPRVKEALHLIGCVAFHLFTSWTSTPLHRTPNNGSPATGPISNGYTPQEGQDLSQASKTATFSDLIRALDFVTSLFQEKEVPCALMGGLALTFRGSKRDTYDLDITAACDMAGLRQVVNNNSRYVAHLVHHLGADFKERMKVPIGPPSGVMRVFVAVENDKWVQVDIMVSGKARIFRLSGSSLLTTIQIHITEPPKSKTSTKLQRQSPSKPSLAPENMFSSTSLPTSRPSSGHFVSAMQPQTTKIWCSCVPPSLSKSPGSTTS